MSESNAGHADTLAQRRIPMLSSPGYIDRSSVTYRISHTGKDALDLLNRMSTNQVLSLQAGQGISTVLTSDRGRIVALLHVACRTPEDLLLLTDTPAELVMEWIDRYTFEEDSSLRDVSAQTAQVALSGPGVESLVGGVASRSGAIFVRTDAPGVPCWELVSAVHDKDRSIEALEAAGIRRATESDWHLARIEHCAPAHPGELNDDANPLEAGLKRFVSFNKGCYIGQEVVARLETYEKVQRTLACISSDVLLTRGEVLSMDGREIGRVTSAVQSTGTGGAVGLAYIRKAVAVPGAVIGAQGGMARIVRAGS